MAVSKVLSNRHPVDQLADVREQIKILKTKEQELRDKIVAKADFDGDENVARLVVTVTAALDRKKLEKQFGVAAVAACSKKTNREALFVARRAVRKSGLFD
jgi:hypothetical protein